MKKIHRIAAIFLAVLVLFAMIASLFTVVLHIGHTCTGEHCPICEIAQACRNTLKSLRNAQITVVATFCLLYLTAFPAPLPVLRSAGGTPISLKVKLLN